MRRQRRGLAMGTPDRGRNRQNGWRYRETVNDRGMEDSRKQGSKQLDKHNVIANGIHTLVFLIDPINYTCIKVGSDLERKS